MRTPGRMARPSLDQTASTEGPDSPRIGRLRAPAWQDVHSQVLSDHGLWRGDRSDTGFVPQREVSYAVGTRPATPTQGGLVRPVLVARADQPADRAGARSHLDYRSRPRGVVDPDSSSSVSPERATTFAPLKSGLTGQGDAGVRPILSSQVSSRPQAQLQDLRKGLALQAQEQDLQVAFVQDSVKEVEHTRTSLAGLAAERERMQRQVQELSAYHEQHKMQTAELRATLSDLQSDTARLQSEQRRQASALKDRSVQKGTELTEKLARQVDSVAAALATQDKRFRALESEVGNICNAQQAQLAEAVEQGRHLARGLEEESARRSSNIAQLQSMLEKVYNREAGQAGKLQTELATATSVVQAHSSDWVQLARLIKAEVSELTGAMKAERNARAVETASQRVELARLLESARRQGVADALEGDGQEFAQDMASRVGAVAVRKMVDSTKSILRNLEEALILRAGFIGGVFHTWRCEATLYKVGRRYQEEFARNQDEWEAHLGHHRRSFEEELKRAADRLIDHKERVRMQHALLLDQWAHGEDSGLKRQTAIAWSSFTKKEKRLRRTAATIQKAVYQWAEGKLLGLVHAIFSAWHRRAREEGLQQHLMMERQDLENKHLSALDVVQRNAEARLEAAVAAMAAQEGNRFKDIEVIISKWERGNDRGLLASVFAGWQHGVELTKAGAAQSEAVQMAVHHFLEGSKRGTLHGCFTAWRHTASLGKAVHAEQKRLEELLTGERALREKEYRQRMDKAQQKIEAAHRAVELVVRKWQFGDDLGLHIHVFQVWSKYCLRKAADSRRAEAVHTVVMKWAEGDRRGLSHSCFIHWKQSAQTASLEKKQQAILQRETEQLHAILADERRRHVQDLQAQEAKAKQKQQEAEVVSELALRKWAEGETRGLLQSVVRDWGKYTKEQKKLARHRQSVHAALLQFTEGGKKAMVHLAFTNWQGLARSEKLVRKEQDRVEQEKAHWEAAQQEMMKMYDKELRGLRDQHAEMKAQAHAVSELMLRQWMGGSKAGMTGTVFHDWRRFVASKKESQRRRATVQAAISQMLEGQRRGILHSAFTFWFAQVKTEAGHKKRLAELENQVESLVSRQQLRLTRYARFLGEAEGPVLLGMVLASWRDAVQGAKFSEVLREKEVQLEEMQRLREMEVTRKKELTVQALEKLGVKDSRLVLLEVFLAWLYLHEQEKQIRIHSINQNKALQKYAEFVLVKAMKKDNASLLASTFIEWHRESKILRHQHVQQQVEDTTQYITQLEQRTTALEEQLWLAYRQIDHITDTLQKELQTKEELTAELRDAYDKMRRSCFSPGGLAGDAGNGSFHLGMRPSSAQNRSHSMGSAGRFSRPNMSGLQSSGLAAQDPMMTRQDTGLGALDISPTAQDSTTNMSSFLGGLLGPGSPTAADQDQTTPLLTPTSPAATMPGDLLPGRPRRAPTTPSGSAVAAPVAPTGVAGAAAGPTAARRLLGGGPPAREPAGSGNTTRLLDRTSNASSPTGCDWDVAVQRMREEGMVRIQGQRL